MQNVILENKWKNIGTKYRQRFVLHTNAAFISGDSVTTQKQSKLTQIDIQPCEESISEQNQEK